MSCSPVFTRLIREQILATPHGERAWTVRRLARLLEVSPSTIYRWAGLRGTPRPRSGIRNCKIESCKSRN